MFKFRSKRILAAVLLSLGNFSPSVMAVEMKADSEVRKDVENMTTADRKNLLEKMTNDVVTPLVEKLNGIDEVQKVKQNLSFARMVHQIDRDMHQNFNKRNKSQLYEKLSSIETRTLNSVRSVAVRALRRSLRNNKEGELGNKLRTASSNGNKNGLTTVLSELLGILKNDVFGGDANNTEAPLGKLCKAVDDALDHEKKLFEKRAKSFESEGKAEKAKRNKDKANALGLLLENKELLHEEIRLSIAKVLYAHIVSASSALLVFSRSRKKLEDEFLRAIRQF